MCAQFYVLNSLLGSLRLKVERVESADEQRRDSILVASGCPAGYSGHTTVHMSLNTIYQLVHIGEHSTSQSKQHTPTCAMCATTFKLQTKRGKPDCMNCVILLLGRCGKVTDTHLHPRPGQTRPSSYPRAFETPAA